ncbi:exosporium leader peptide, partial [Ostertagia ostertagi]
LLSAETLTSTTGSDWSSRIADEGWSDELESVSSGIPADWFSGDQILDMRISIRTSASDISVNMALDSDESRLPSEEVAVARSDESVTPSDPASDNGMAPARNRTHAPKLERMEPSSNSSMMDSDDDTPEEDSILDGPIHRPNDNEEPFDYETSQSTFHLATPSNNGSPDSGQVIGPTLPPASIGPSLPPPTIGPSLPPTIGPSLPPASIGPSLPPVAIGPALPTSITGPSLLLPVAGPSPPTSGVGPSLPSFAGSSSLSHQQIGPSLPPSSVEPSILLSNVGPSPPTSGIGPSLPAPTTWSALPNQHVGPSLPPTAIGPSLPPQNIGPALPRREIGPALPPGFAIGNNGDEVSS